VRADRQADALAANRELRHVQRQILFNIQDDIDGIIPLIAKLVSLGQRTIRESSDKVPSELPSPDLSNANPEELEAGLKRLEEEFAHQMAEMNRDFEKVTVMLQQISEMNQVFVKEVSPKSMKLVYAAERVSNDELRAIVRDIAKVTNDICDQLIEWPERFPPGIALFTAKRRYLNEKIRTVYLGGDPRSF